MIVPVYDYMLFKTSLHVRMVFATTYNVILSSFLTAHIYKKKLRENV